LHAILCLSFFLCLANFKLAQGQDDCRDHMTCLQCFEDPNCGWCQDKNLCVEGNATGPAYGSCDWDYYNCPSTTKSPSTTSTTTTTPAPSVTPAPSSPYEPLQWVTVGTYLSTSDNGTVVTRVSTEDTWTTAWVNATICSSGIFNNTVEMVHYYDDPDNYYNAVMGLVSQSCAESYTGYNINEIIGWYGYGGCGGWSYISEDGYTLADNTASSYGLTWMRAGTKVTMTADLDAGTIVWYVNGVSQGQAFSDVSQDNYYVGVSIISPTTSMKIISSTCSSNKKR